MNNFKKILDFFSCLLHENCEYSIKKILTYIFTFLVIYMILFTDKEYHNVLLFIAGLLGIRGVERIKLWDNQYDDTDYDSNLSDDSKLGKKRNKKSGGKQILTD